MKSVYVCTGFGECGILQLVETIDYNGTGRWSSQAIQERYLAYARSLKVSPLFDLTLRTSKDGQRCWIYPLMNEVIKGIEAGDKACAQIGVDFIEEDEFFPFGMILKVNTARALRRADLTPDQIERVRKRVVAMLIEGNTPREYRQYAKLLRKVGLGDWWPVIEKQAPCLPSYALRHFNYFKQHIRPK